LHAGHLNLVQRAQEIADRVVVSIFINPLQFGPHEDFAEYPRTFEADCVNLAVEEIDLLFAPSEENLFPLGREHQTRINVPGLSDILCGEVRPGFFSGVATIVAKLFNIVTPDVAIFGQKDYQQWLVVNRMIADMNMPIQCMMVPTMREKDGLAMSSRNQYLSKEERALAPLLYSSLQVCADIIRAEGYQPDAIAQISNDLSRQGLKIDYFTGRHQIDLSEPQHGTPADDLVILGAVRLGSTRLIDNILINPPPFSN
jgi:pantoate--beta-alanine ligase